MVTEPREQKAQRLVDEGKVKLWTIRKFETGTIVRAACGEYLITLYPNGHYDCGCAWGQLTSHTDDLCVHALAVRLVAEKED